MTTDTGLSYPASQESHGEVPVGTEDALRDLLFLLAGRWKFLLRVALGGGVAALLIAIAIPNVYTATVLLIPPARPQSLSAALAGQLGGLAGALAPSLGLKDPTEMYMGILRSRAVTDAIVNQFGLQRLYSSKTRQDARSELLDHADFALGRDTMIKISVKDRDPRRAAALANAFVTELNQQNNRLALTEAGQRRLFFEHEVESEKTGLAESENALRETQQRTGVMEVSNQAQLVMGSIARLRADIALQEVSLQRLQMGATAANPEVAKQQTELSALRGELSKLEAGSTQQRSGDPIVPVANVPKAGLEYLRALREVKYHDSLFEVLSKQYEAARIDEAREAPLIQVVDAAVPPEKKSFPPRTLITILGAILAAVCGGVYLYSVQGKHSNQFLPARPAVTSPPA